MYPKVLIVSASIGAGHTRAAEAIRAEMVAKGNVDATIVDFLDGEDRLARVIKEVYFKMLDVFPHAYEILYRWSDEPHAGSNLSELAAFAMKRKMQQLLNKYRPDLVIFTHPFPCCAAALLRRNLQMGIPMVAVLTDFAVHRLWIHTDIDAYFVANEEMRESLVIHGVDNAKVNVSGIPIIRQKSGRRQILPTTGSQNEPSILIMGGGTGYGSIEKALDSLATISQRLNITVAAGNNTALRQRLYQASQNMTHKVNILGFTDRIQELMAEATLLITKPGALTCSEALAIGLPMILINPIPGQEEENADYLLRQGVSINVNNYSKLGQTVSNLFNDSEKLADMRIKSLAIAHPNAADTVARTIAGRFFLRRDTSFAG